MDRLRRSTINMLSSLAGYAVPMVVNFVTVPLLLSSLGEAAFGLQSLVAVIIGYLTVADMGLDLPVTKFTAEDHARNDILTQNRTLSTAFQLYAVIGLVGMTSALLAAHWLANDVFRVPIELRSQAAAVFQLAGVGFLGNVFAMWGRGTAMGLQRFEIAYGISVATNILGICSGLLLVYLGYGVVGYVLMRVIMYFVAGVVNLMMVHRLIPNFRIQWGIDRATFRRIRGYLGYGVTNRVVSGLVSRLDQSLIGVWLGVALAGVYAVPIMVVTYLGNMIVYLIGFFLPTASELDGLGQLDNLRDVFIRTSRFVVSIASLIFMPMLALFGPFLKLWVGAGLYAQVSGVLPLVVLASFIGISSSAMISGYLPGTGHMRQLTAYLTTRYGVLGAGLFVLIRYFGLIGAGWALVVATIVDVVALVVVVRKYLMLSFYHLLQAAYFKPILLGIGLALLAFMAQPLASSWAGLVMVYAGLLSIHVLVGSQIGIYGDTERRALLGIWKSLARRFGVVAGG